MALPFLMPQRNSNARGAGRGYSLEFLVGMCHAVLQILTLFGPKQCHFSHPFSDMASKFHTHSQTWPLRNYVIIT